MFSPTYTPPEKTDLTDFSLASEKLCEAFFDKLKTTLRRLWRRVVFSDKPDYSCFWALILTPGPIVEAVTQERIYWPLAVAGLALMIAVIRAE